MSLELHILNSTGVLTGYVDKIQSTWKKAVTASNLTLSLDNVDVVVRHLPAFTIPELAIGGFTDEDGHSIYMSVDAVKGFKTGDLYSQLIHELYHAKRFQQLKLPRNLAGNLVAEGLACLFEEEQSGKVPIYAKVKISKDVINKAKRQFFAPKYSHKVWFFGSKKQNIPRWFGYTYGYELCKKYSGETNKKAHELVTTPEKEILTS